MSQALTPEGRITSISKHNYFNIAAHTGAGVGALPDSLIL